MWTKISGVPSPRVRKPKPRSRLNHLTCARSSPLVGVTVTWVRGGGICAGCTADDPCALIGGLIAVTAQAGHMQKDVRHSVVGDDEPKSLRNIEPLDDARQF